MFTEIKTIVSMIIAFQAFLLIWKFDNIAPKHDFLATFSVESSPNLKSSELEMSNLESEEQMEEFGEKFLQAVSQTELISLAEVNNTQKITQELISLLKNSLALDFPEKHFEFECYGSAIIDNHFKGSDIDVTILTDSYVDERTFLTHLEKIVSLHYNKTKLLVGPNASFPLLSVEKDSVTMEILVNNHLGVYSSNLAKLYYNLDERVRILCRLVRIWASQNGIKKGKGLYYATYTYNELVLFYLQREVQPPLIPSIQKIAKEMNYPVNKKILERNYKGSMQKFEVDSTMIEDLQVIKDYMKRNMTPNFLSVLDLLKGFFQFYALDYQKLPEHERTISIREADYLINYQNDSDLVFSIEDPFDPTINDGHRVSLHCVDKTKKISDAFLYAYELMNNDKIHKLFKY